MQNKRAASAALLFGDIRLRAPKGKTRVSYRYQGYKEGFHLVCGIDFQFNRTADILIRVAEILAEREQPARKRELVGQIQGLLTELQKMEGENPTLSNTIAALSPDNAARFMKKGNFDLDLHARHATLNGKYIPVTGIYFDYLSTLLRHAPKAVEYRSLVKASQGYEVAVAEARDLARWRIHELRQMIEADPEHPQYILTVRGVGYRLAI